jgi:hypothetical protein
MKLKEKRREGGKYHKTYHRAQTPAERLLAWSGLSEDKRAWITRQKREQDPVKLHRRVEIKLRVLWKIARYARDQEDVRRTFWRCRSLRSGLATLDLHFGFDSAKRWCSVTLSFNLPLVSPVVGQRSPP